MLVFINVYWAMKSPARKIDFFIFSCRTSARDSSRKDFSDIRGVLRELEVAAEGEEDVHPISIFFSIISIGLVQTCIALIMMLLA